MIASPCNKSVSSHPLFIVFSWATKASLSH